VCGIENEGPMNYGGKNCDIKFYYFCETDYFINALGNMERKPANAYVVDNVKC